MNSISRKRLSCRGFTLIELVLALGIMGITFTSLIYLRESAIEKVSSVIKEREIQKTAQELLERKLAESMSNEIEDIAGEVPGHPDWTWEWFRDVQQEGGEFLYEYTLALTYPDYENRDNEPKRFELKRWIQPSEEELREIVEDQQLLESSEGGSWGTGGNESY